MLLSFENSKNYFCLKIYFFKSASKSNPNLQLSLFGGALCSQAVFEFGKYFNGKFVSHLVMRKTVETLHIFFIFLKIFYFGF